MKAYVVAILASVCLRAADAPAEVPFDVKAERARRDAIRKARQTEADEKFKKTGTPYVLSKVEARFPAEATKDYHLLKVRVAIDEKGIVRGISFPETPEPDFEMAAAQAIWRWRYSPRIVDGVAVRCEVEEYLNFIRPKKVEAP